MNTYEDLQRQHQELLNRRENGEDPLVLHEAILEYIQRVRQESQDVSDPRDRDQLRANLRFWATFLYDQTGIYPKTNLMPSLVPLEPAADAGKAVAMEEKGASVVHGPLHLPRWIPILGGGILILLVILVVMVFPLLLPPSQAVQATQEESLVIQNTSMSILQTSAAQPTMTPQPPTATSSRTPNPSATPDLINTVDVRLTESAATATAVAPTPTATSVIWLPDVSYPEQSEEIYSRTALIASVYAVPNPNGCGSDTLQISFDLDLNEIESDDERETLESLSPQDFQVSVSRVGGTAREITTLRSSPDGIGVATAVSANAAYLIRVQNPAITASDVIVQFDDKCSQSQFVRYSWQEIISALPEQPKANDQLSLDWILTSWGPVPQLSANQDTPWVATYRLSATGGDGNYIYWSYDGQFKPLNGDQLVLQGSGSCKSAYAVVSVTSGGLSVIREIVLLSPFCYIDEGNSGESCTPPQISVQKNTACRTGPGTVYDVMTAFQPGLITEVDGRNADSTWLWLLLPSTESHCWASVSNLRSTCSLDDLPVIAAPPTPTPTFIPTSTPEGAKLENVNASTTKFYYHASTCAPNSVTLSLDVTDPAGISSVDIFFRLKDAKSDQVTSWSSQKMESGDYNHWAFTIYPENGIPDYELFVESTMQYYFVITNAKGVQNTTTVYQDVTLALCE